jgi:hypothetical protein
MRIAVLTNGEESERIAGWLADEGQVVRRLADSAALAAFDPRERFDWVICDATLRDACLDALGQRDGASATRCLLIGDPGEGLSADGVTWLARPLRRRLLLSVVRAPASSQVRGTK